MKLKPFILLAFLTLLAAHAQAQLIVSVALARSNYIANEPLMAVVTIENRAGKDIVLGGPNKTSWLNVDVYTSDGRLLAPDGGSPSAEPTVIKDRAKITRSVNLMKFFPVENPGAYTVSASVYFPDLQRYIKAGRSPAFMINSPKTPFWERTVGLPKNHSQYGRYRRFKLFTSKSNFLLEGTAREVKLLYIQIIDEETGLNVSTYPLGEILTQRDPQPTTDKDGTLHVLYLCDPQTYCHTTIDCDGAVLDQKLFRNGTSSPNLMESSDGYVTVRGGRLYDPITEADKARSDANDVRSLSDRPPGLPARSRSGE